MNGEKAERCLKIGLCGAVLTLIGFLGICLEFPALMTVWSLIRETFDVPMPGE